MQPTTPGFHEVRSMENCWQLAAADSAVKLSEAELQRIQAALDYSQSELNRSQALFSKDGISRMALDKVTFDVQTNEAALMSAQARLDVSRSGRASIAARLKTPTKNV